MDRYKCASSVWAPILRWQASPRWWNAHRRNVRNWRTPASAPQRRFVARVSGPDGADRAAWSFLDPSRAFSAALAVLVVSCPCAFALAVPAAITRALAVLARCGVLVVRPDAIQALAEATHIVFDKTGTLTEPQLALADVATFDGVSRDAALRLAASLGRESRHPVARAIAAARGERAGRAGDRCELASQDLASAARLQDAIAPRPQLHFALAVELQSTTTPFVLADDCGPDRGVPLEERLRPGARAAIDALKAQGLKVCIASGDAATKVADVAAQLEISDWRARQLPADKLDMADDIARGRRARHRRRRWCQ